MERMFTCKNSDGTGYGRFFVSVSRKSGVKYELLEGKAPCWYDVLQAIASLVSKMRIPPSGMYSYHGNYSIIQDRSIEPRFIPVLIEDGGVATLFPFTVEYYYILEDYFEMSFEMAIKVMLVSCMTYSQCALLRDKRKAKKFEECRVRESILQPV